MPRKSKNETLDGDASAYSSQALAQGSMETSEKTMLPASFYDLDINELDKDLSSEQQEEWTAIYASYRSRSPLAGVVIGVESHMVPVTDSEAAGSVKEIICLIVMDFRVKVIIPHTEVWYEPRPGLSERALWSMVGAKVDYIVTSIDRIGDCALASRKIALGLKRNRFMLDRRGFKVGDMVDCSIMLVGPKSMTVECNGFDLRLSQRDVSYTAKADLRKEYKPGQETRAKLIKVDKKSNTIQISIKETNPNPFDGAEHRHPIGCARAAVISGTYAGGVFCRLSDDTNVLCNYSPSYFAEKFYVGDKVQIRIYNYDYSKKQVYGRITSKL